MIITSLDDASVYVGEYVLVNRVSLSGERDIEVLCYVHSVKSAYGRIDFSVSPFWDVNGPQTWVSVSRCIPPTEQYLVNIAKSLGIILA